MRRTQAKMTATVDAEAHPKTPASFAKTIRERLGASKELAIVYMPLIDICGDHNSALLLSQSLYWTERSSDPDGWFYKTERDWFNELRFKRSKHEHAREKLQSLGFLDIKVRGLPPTVHHRVNLSAVHNAVEYVRNLHIEIAPKRHIKSVRNGQIERAKGTNQNAQKAQINLHESRRTYKEAETTAEKPRQTPEMERTKTELPPTPLFEGGGESATEEPDKTVGLLADFKFQLKKDMLEASFCAKHLASDDYDLYFRDAYFWGISNGVVLVDGAAPDITAEGLKKYERRLKDTYRKTVGIDVEFQMAEMSGAAENALAPTGRQGNANG
ncbi:MAG: hypothetical protein WA532_09725 [Candidatus Korobacteraceae bacterium]